SAELSPSILFAGAPPGPLDQPSGAELLDVPPRPSRHSGPALVVVTHAPGVARHCSRTVTMRDGRISGEFFAPGTHPASGAPQAAASQAAASATVTQPAPPAPAPPAPPAHDAATQQAMAAHPAAGYGPTHPSAADQESAR